MDGKRFDYLAQQIGAQNDRRAMLKTAAGGTLALLGLGALGRTAFGQEVTAEGKGFNGDKCKKNSDCKKGLKCKNKNNNGKCRYKNSCGGKKNDACQNNKDCCGGFKCKGHKCKKK